MDPQTPPRHEASTAGPTSHPANPDRSGPIAGPIAGPAVGWAAAAASSTHNPRPTPRPTPHTVPRSSSLPVSLGVACVVVDDQAAWAFRYDTGPSGSGLIESGSEGDGLFAALSAALRAAPVHGRPVVLWVYGSSEARSAIAEVAPSLGRIRVNGGAGSWGTVDGAMAHQAREAAIALLPDHDRARAATRLPSTPMRRVTVATDGSAGHGGWGAAWIGDTGAYGTDAEDDCGRGNSRARYAEFHAVAAALEAHPFKRPLRILTDCLALIETVEKHRAQTPTYAQAASLPRPLARIMVALRGRDVEFEHVRAHQGNVLNQGADRLAVNARRAVQLRTPEATRTATLARIAAETMTSYAADGEWTEHHEPGALRAA